MDILIVGAGALGSRHLQACLKINIPCKIYVVDPSTDSISIAKERADQVKTSVKHETSYYQSITDIGVNCVDYAIVATNAIHRYGVSKEIIEKLNPKAMILEKVLFQSVEHYTKFSQLLLNRNITIFVNCPFRSYPVYKYIKRKYLGNNENISLSYTGGEWIGLCCNAIHYIDLVNYLSDSGLSSIETEELDPDIIESKRSGYVEFTGKLTCHFYNNSVLYLNSIKDSDICSELVIENGEYKFIINELSGELSVFKDGCLYEERNFDIVYQSDLTNILIEQIEHHSGCDLITYPQSATMHVLLISSLLGFYNKKNNISSDVLPIT